MEAYRLKVRKLSREELKTRVEEVLKLNRLEGLEKRKPFQLSGRQR